MNIVVRYPCLVFVIILVLCLGITVNLSKSAFKAGNPFTPDDSTFDLYDKRSLAYDGLRLAKEELAALRDDVSSPTGENEEVKKVLSLENVVKVKSHVCAFGMQEGDDT